MTEPTAPALTFDQQMTAIEAGLSQMSAAAASGDLRLEDGAGTAIKAHLDSALGHARMAAENANRLIIPAQLGSNVVSTAITTKFVSRAQDSDSLIPLLGRFENAIEATTAAVVAATESLRNADQDSASTFRG